MIEDRTTAGPTSQNRYLNRNGRYSNGYFGSPDHLEDIKPDWDKAMKNIKTRIDRHLFIQRVKEEMEKGYKYLVDKLR